MTTEEARVRLRTKLESAFGLFATLVRIT